MNLALYALLGVFLAWIIHFYTNELDITKQFDLSLPRHSCTKQETPWLIGAEDLVWLGGKATIVGSYNDNAKLWENAHYGPPKTPDGGLFVAYDVDSDKPQVGGGEDAVGDDDD